MLGAYVQRGGQIGGALGGVVRGMVGRRAATSPVELHVLRSECTDPSTNLATEEWLQERARGAGRVVHTLFLWRNRPTVVIGAHQNAARECDLGAMRAAGVALARRRTGGGAVYHDLANTNYTFVTAPARAYAAADAHAVTVDALRRAFGLRAAASGRNDICVATPAGPRKVSGCAFRRRANAVLHHGTMLLDTDLAALGRLLTPAPAKLRAKGVASVRARVANVSALVGRRATHAELCAAFEEAFVAHHTARDTAHGAPRDVRVRVATLDAPALLRRDRTLRRMRDALASYDWRFGHDPAWGVRLEARRPWGTADLRLDVVRGRIAHAALFTDCLNTAVARTAADALRGCRYTRRDVVAAVDRAAADAVRAARRRRLRAPEALPEALEAQEYLRDFAIWVASNANV